MKAVTKRSATKSGKQAPNGFVRPQTAQQAVTDALRDEIITGARAPGTQIVQETLADQFQMSRIPIREALKTLEAEEHVVYEPHSGYRVSQLGLDELSEVFRLRDILEEELIRDALPHVTDDVVDRMRAAMVEMDDAAARDDLVTIGKANRRFHYLVFETSSMARTKRIVNQLWNTADAYRPLYASLLDIAKVNAEHVFIVDAVSARDVDCVVSLNYEHRKHSIDHLRQVLGGAA